MFLGFTKMCKVLAVVLVCGHIVVVHIFPSSIIYVALVPARTIPFGWNLITASYIEQSTHGVVISTISLLFIGKLLEPIWGRREFLKFIFVVNFVTNVCVFISAIFVYYITLEEIYIYTPLSGFGGALSGLLVGVKQLIPDHELYPFKIKAMWAPSIMLFLSIVMSFFTVELAIYLPMLISGTYFGWIYLRYFQKKQETKIKGDSSDEFAFSTFFPEFLRPLINPISSIFHQMLRGRNVVSNESKGYIVNMHALPGSDSIEASRRRQRGERALEERLALKSIERTIEPHVTEKV